MARTFFGFSQLFGARMQFFDLPAHVVCILKSLWDHIPAPAAADRVCLAAGRACQAESRNTHSPKYIKAGKGFSPPAFFVLPLNGKK